MKRMLVKLAKAFLERNGYRVESKAQYQLVPDFILRMQRNNAQPLDPLDWAEEQERV